MTDQYADALLKQRDAFRKNMSSAADKLPMKRAAAEMDNNNQPTTAITTTTSSSSFSAFGSPINSMNASMPNMANMRGFGGFGGIGKPDPFSTDLKKPFLMNMMPKPTGSGIHTDMHLLIYIYEMLLT